MTINIGHILGNLCELLLFIYFANTTFHPRKSYLHSNLVSLCGYAVLWSVGLISNLAVSLAAFFIINIILLLYCYSVRLEAAIFYSLILNALSAVGEYMLIYILGFRYTVTLSMLNFYQSMYISIGGKLIYSIGILFLKKFLNKKLIYYNDSEIVLAIIPFISILILTLMLKFEMNKYIFLLICFAFLIFNFVTFYINKSLSDKNRKLEILEDKYNKGEVELSEYQLLSEKYESSKIVQHDLYKQLDVLRGLISEDNSRAEKYIQDIRFLYREAAYTEYSDNKILNILFAQKIKECHKRGIEIHIHSSAPTLSFISDIDTVAIFSNMLDNAIEAAEQSEKKEIFVDLYTVNESYSAVKVENYADKEPIIRGGVLHTRKQNTDDHGIGIKSINNALKNYNSELTWSYDKEKKFFRVSAIIHIPN